jgi:hypothetical protein
MQVSLIPGVLLTGLLAGACGATGPARSQQRATDAAAAVKALQAGDFAAAGKEAGAAIGRGDGNGHARVVRAIVAYKAAVEQLALDTMTVVQGARGGFNHQVMRTALDNADKALAQVDEDLAVAGKDELVSLELCLACWKVDWNRSGEIDRRDDRLLELEVDAKGERLPEGDPRRRPTFRFDVGDTSWARAWLAFQRALVHLTLSYDWQEVDKLARRGGPDSPVITIRLADGKRVTRGRDLILEALEHSGRAREQYLAETDDDREWLPNPKQQNHPMPLPVDQALYDTWAALLGDARKLVKGDEGLPVAELVELAEVKMAGAPPGVVDVGGLLSNPKDITVSVMDVLAAKLSPEQALKDILGRGYRTDLAKSPIPSRLARLKSEIKMGTGTLEQKLRYLLWVN